MFDLGETLLNFNLEGKWRETLKNEVIPRMFTALLSQSKEFNQKRVDPNLFSETVYKYIAVDGKEKKKVSMISRIKKYFEFFGIPQYATYIQSQIAAFASTMQERVKIYPEVRETLEWLSEQEYTLGMWSDTPWQCPGSLIEQYMRKYNIRKYFDVALFSGDREDKKPNPEVFQMVLDVAGKKKDQMVYIGNSKKDILTSKRFGIPIIWIDRIEAVHNLSEDTPQPDYIINSLIDLKDLLPID